MAMGSGGDKSGATPPLAAAATAEPGDGLRRMDQVSFRPVQDSTTTLGAPGSTRGLERRGGARAGGDQLLSDPARTREDPNKLGSIITDTATPAAQRPLSSDEQRQQQSVWQPTEIHA